MASLKMLKAALLGTFALLLALWLGSGAYSRFFPTTGNNASALSVVNADDQTGYVGSETCATCHEDQFKEYSSTKHAKLADMKGWKDKVQGCESCHGPGKDHVEGGGDKTKIVSFKGKNSKEISESCLACHAGSETHSNFRRGDHWRNDVGCTDCHTAHGPKLANFTPGSLTQPGDATVETPGGASAMLKSSEPQLCISCHSETKSQFLKASHHKVLEGAMKCSDCHNAHGGFEQKQTNLAVGNDTACVKCHTDKQGPFVFEHAPLKAEGCSACHTPHGSANPKMLKRPQVRQLCYECHSGITEQLSDGPTGGPHGQLSVRSQNCTVCHSAIHGSNTNAAFFR